MMQAAEARSIPATFPPVYHSKRARLTLIKGNHVGAESQRQDAEGRRPKVTTISFEVFDEHLPALRSAVEEITNEVGGRLEGLHRYAKEHALTRAACALGALRAAVCKAAPTGDAQYV